MSGSQSYSVSARLQITGNAEQVLRALGRQLVSLNARIQATERNLQKLASAVGALGNLAAAATRTNTAIDALRSSTGALSSATAGANRVLERQERVFERNARAAQRLTMDMQAATRQANSLAIASRIQPIPVGGRRRTVGGADDDDAPRSRNRLRDRLTNPGPWETLYAGRAAAGGLARIIEAGATEGQMVATLRAQQVSPQFIEEMTRRAPEMVRQVPGATNAEAMGAVREARMALGTSAPVDQVMQLAPAILRAARVSAAVTGRSTAEGLRPLARYVAMTGAFTDQAGNLDMAAGLRSLQALEAQILAFTTGQREGIDPRELENLAKQSAQMLRRMEPEGQAALMTRLQEIGGQRTGTEFTALTDFFVNNQGPQRNLDRASRLGLRIRTQQEAVRARQEQTALAQRWLQEGRITQREFERIQAVPMGIGQFYGRGIATVRPTEFIPEVVGERLRRRGLTSEEQQIDALMSLAPRQTSRRTAVALLQERETQEDIAAFQQIMRAIREGQDVAGSYLRESPVNAQANLSAALTNIAAALGNVPGVVDLLNQMAGNLNDLADWIRRNPETIIGFFSDLKKSWEGMVATIERTREELTMIREKMGQLVERAGKIVEAVQALDQRLNTLIPYLRQNIPGGTPMPGADGRPVVPLPSGRPGFMIPPIPLPRRDPAVQEQGFLQGPTGRGDTVIQTRVDLDGRTIADVISRHQGRAAQAPTNAAPRYDRYMAPLLPDGMATA